MNRSVIALHLWAVSAVATAAVGEETPACVFCEIAEGRKDPDQVVYRDDHVIAFMTHGARNPGHLLIAPRTHVRDFLEASPETLARLTQTSQRLASAIRAAGFHAEGFTLATNSGSAAGQTVFHLHLHVIPRYAGEGKPAGKLPDAELIAQAARIKRSMETGEK